MWVWLANVRHCCRRILNSTILLTCKVKIKPYRRPPNFSEMDRRRSHPPRHRRRRCRAEKAPSDPSGRVSYHLSSSRLRMDWVVCTIVKFIIWSGDLLVPGLQVIVNRILLADLSFLSVVLPAPNSDSVKTLRIPRRGKDFGFTLRHFIVYPPEVSFSMNNPTEGERGDVEKPPKNFKIAIRQNILDTYAGKQLS